MIVILFFVLVIAPNPNGCPASPETRDDCDISCCVSDLMPGPAHNDDGELEPPGRLFYWNERIEQKNYADCGYCYLQFKKMKTGKSWIHFASLLDRVCPMWDIRYQELVMFPDGSNQGWICPIGYECALIVDRTAEETCRKDNSRNYTTDRNLISLLSRSYIQTY